MARNINSSGVVGSNAGGSSGGGGAPTGAAGGDLSGTYPNPTLSTTVAIPSAATATTASAADSSTKVATTAFVTTADNLKANLAGPTFTGVVTLPTGTVATTQSAADGSTKLATTAYVDTADALKANLAGPTFTGAPTLPTGTIGVTQAVLDNSTKLATTAYTDRAVNHDWSFYIDGQTANRRSTIPRFAANSATQAISGTGVMTSYPILLWAGDIITSLNWMIGTYTAGANTHSWGALYDTQATPALIAQSTDATTASITQNAILTHTLNSPAPYTVTTTGIHYVAIMVATSNAVPLLCGINTQSVVNIGPSGGKALGRSSGSSLTATAPSTIAGSSTLNGMVYCATS